MKNKIKFGFDNVCYYQPHFGKLLSPSVYILHNSGGYCIKPKAHQLQHQTAAAPAVPLAPPTNNNQSVAPPKSKI